MKEEIKKDKVLGQGIMSVKKYETLSNIEELVRELLLTMTTESSHIKTKPEYKIDWVKGQEYLENNGRKTKDYKRLVFYVEELKEIEVDKEYTTGEGEFAVTKTVPVKEKHPQKVLLYEGVYFNTPKTLLNPGKTLETAYKHFIANGIRNLAYQSYQMFLNNQNQNQK